MPPGPTSRHRRPRWRPSGRASPERFGVLRAPSPTAQLTTIGPSPADDPCRYTTTSKPPALTAGCHLRPQCPASTPTSLATKLHPSRAKPPRSGAPPPLPYAAASGPPPVPPSPMPPAQGKGQNGFPSPFSTFPATWLAAGKARPTGWPPPDHLLPISLFLNQGRRREKHPQFHSNPLLSPIRKIALPPLSNCFHRSALPPPKSSYKQVPDSSQLSP
uniref:Uncharacterized protein n=1 Tax=Setaria viridis TaxID=4556 RepID=A0A4U6UWR0_SETVI|nr:hypothetical protein SEVIR_4G187900v2 [Setaria viridis]